MQTKTVLMYAVVCFVGCTCESEHRELAVLDEPSARLEADYVKRLGCAGGGGHGAGIIVPDVKRKYNQTLHIEDGPLAGNYRTPEQCACRGDEATLDIDVPGRRALVGCDDQTWHVYYLIPPGTRMHCLKDAFDARPMWTAVPSLSDGIVDIMGEQFLASFVADVAQLEGDEAAAEVLTKTVDIGGPKWVETVQALPAELQARPLAALRDALKLDDVPNTALFRAHALPADDRALIIAAIERYSLAPDTATPHHLRPYHYGSAQSALTRLAESGADDLVDTACTMLAANRCHTACLSVFDRTDAVCDGLAEHLTWHACRAENLCDGECSEERLLALLDDPPPRAENRAATRAYLAAMRRPELAHLVAQWDRHRYDVDRSVVGCAAYVDQCACTDNTNIRQTACQQPLSVETVDDRGCRIAIDDVGKKLIPAAIESLPATDVGVDFGHDG